MSESTGVQSDVERFDELGFFIQRGAISGDVVAQLDAAIDDCRRSPGPHHAVLGGTAEAVFDSDLFRWRDVAAIGSLIDSDSLVAQAERLLGSSVVFVEDQWFSADAASAAGSPWHQDDPYYEIDRGFATCWIPLEDVTADHSLNVIPASHLDGTQLAAVAFDPLGETVSSAGSDDQPITESSTTFDPRDAVSFDMAAGDALWFQPGTVHGLPNPSPTGGRRFSLRYAPVDARRQTTSRTAAAFWNTLPHGLTDGDLLADSPWFPRLTPRSQPLTAHSKG